MRIIDHTGKKYHRLTALKFEKQVGTVKYWLYKCDCGQPHVAASNQVKFGHIKSCGCLHREFVVKPRRGKHKMIKSAEYRIWCSMRLRCRRTSDSRYGGRGIAVCDRWADFAPFYNDMGPRPSPAHSLDRINNDGNYEKDNCRWATAKEQATNRHNTIFVNVRGKAMPLYDASIALGLKYQTAYWRFKRGLPLVKIAA